MDYFFDRELARAKAGESILFPNFIYERDNEYISDDGKKEIKNYENIRPELSSEKEDGRYFSGNYENNIPIDTFDINAKLFSLRSEKWVTKVLDLENNPLSEKIFGNKQKITDLSEQDLISIFKKKIQDRTINIPKNIERNCIWATKYEEIKSSKSINDIISRLGLDHYCSQKDLALYGLVFQVKGKIYKPNITNNPSSIAYCCKPLTPKEQLGRTIHLTQIKQDCGELLVPLTYFRSKNVIIVNVKRFDLKEIINFDKEKVITYIQRLLSFDPSKNYEKISF